MKLLPKIIEGYLIFLKSIMKEIIPEMWHPQAQRTYLMIVFHLRSLWSLWYVGNRLICPCCNGHFRNFITFGVKPRPNAQCPRCGSLERHRLLWLYLRDKTNFFKDSLKVLDIAPMYFFQQKCKTLSNLNYISADISSPIAMTKMDITNINLPDNQFDCIICYHVLEHIPDDKKAMKQLFRMLKPGGWAILESPVDPHRDETFEDPNVVSPKERERIFGHKDHVRIYAQDYKSRLEMAGFTVELDNYSTELGDNIIKKYGLMKDEIIYFCSKPKLKK